MDRLDLRPPVDLGVALLRGVRAHAGGEIGWILLELAEAILEGRDALEVLVEPDAIRGAELALEGADVLHDGVEHATAVPERRVGLGVGARLTEALAEQALVEGRGVGLAVVGRVGPGVGEHLVRLHAHLHRSVGGVGADRVRHDLVDRRARGRPVVVVPLDLLAGEQAGGARPVGADVVDLRGVAAQHGEAVLEGGEGREGLGERVVGALPGGGPPLGAVAVAPEPHDEALGEAAVTGGGAGAAPGEDLEPREGEGDEAAAEHTTEKASATAGCGVRVGAGTDDAGGALGAAARGDAVPPEAGARVTDPIRALHSSRAPARRKAGLMTMSSRRDCQSWPDWTKPSPIQSTSSSSPSATVRPIA